VLFVATTLVALPRHNQTSVCRSICADDNRLVIDVNENGMKPARSVMKAARSVMTCAG